MNLNQITVPVLDINESISFYQTLGLQLIVHSNAHYARFVCPNGTSTFSVHQVNTISKGEGIWVYFECENLDETVEAMQRKGIQFDELPSDKPWLWREARLKDPDQNQIILYYAGKNRLCPPWRL